MTGAADPAEFTIRPSAVAGLFDVQCATCGGCEVMEGDQPVVEQLAVFHLLHEACRRPRRYGLVPAQRRSPVQ